MARDFNGTSDLIDLGSPAALDDLGGVGGPNTFTAWINPDTVGEGNLGRMYDKAVFLQFRLGTAANPRLTHQPGSWSTTVPNANSANDTIVLGVWQFVAGTFTAGDGGPRLWRGTPSVSVAELSYAARTAEAGTASSDAADNAIIGNNPGATRTFDGRIAFLSAYGADLSESGAQTWRLDALRLWPFAPWHKFSVGALAGHWPLWESDAAVARDYSGNDSHGTVTGTVVTEGPQLPLLRGGVHQ